MSIDEAARATRRYVAEGHYVHNTTMVGMIPLPERYNTEAEAQAACDRLNLVAVLEVLRPILIREFYNAALRGDNRVAAAEDRADALIAEAKEHA